MLDHRIPPRPGTVLRAGIFSPTLSPLDTFDAPDTFAWIALDHASAKHGDCRSGCVDQFRAAPILFLHSRFRSLESEFFSVGLVIAIRFDGITSWVSHLGGTTKKGQPAKNGRLPAL